MTSQVRAVVVGLLTLASVVLPGEALGRATVDQAWPMPEIKLSGMLGQIFTISGCEYISGLTCRLAYNGKLPLPSEVFFTEYDEAGKKLGKKTRLIYPHLKARDRGRATFRLRSSTPAKIVLEGVWNGPWKDPY